MAEEEDPCPNLRDEEGSVSWRGFKSKEGRTEITALRFI
jgi:hypothetical protein